MTGPAEPGDERAKRQEGVDVVDKGPGVGGRGVEDGVGGDGVRGVERLRHEGLLVVRLGQARDADVGNDVRGAGYVGGAPRDGEEVGDVG